MLATRPTVVEKAYRYCIIKCCVSKIGQASHFDTLQLKNLERKEAQIAGAQL